MNSNNFFVYDNNGKIIEALNSFGQNFSIFNDLNSIPQTLEILIIGSNSINKENRKILSEKVKSLLKEGKKIVIFEQDAPFEKSELPLNIEVAKPKKSPIEIYGEFLKPEGASGSICFPVALSHPVLEGLSKDDFFTWVDDYIFKSSYKTPEKGAISIIQAGDDLNLTPMLEIREGKGSLILCQLLIGEKFEKEPVAQKFLYNILAYLDKTKTKPERKTYLYHSGDEKLKEFIKSTATKFEEISKIEDCLNENSVSIIKGTKENLKFLLSIKNKVEDYLKNGNWIVIFNVEPQSINEFNNLVEFNHRIRKFRKEKVLIEDLTEPIFLGLTDRDFSMFSDEVLAPWIKLNWVSDKVFTYVVDGKDIASFGGNGKVAQVTNGLTNEDFWRYIQYLNAYGDSIEFDFKRPEIITEIRIKPTSEPYYKLKDIEIIFDDKPDEKIVYICSEKGGFQDIILKEPKICSKIKINNLNFWPGVSTQNLVGIDIIEIYRKVEKIEKGEVKPLTKPAGIVKYPKGNGGILLIQIDYYSPDTKENISKKVNIVSNILRNLIY